MTRKKELMSMDLFKKIVDDCVAEGVETFNLNFYNEPFLDLLIFERIRYIKLKHVRVQLFSNASLMDESMVEKLLTSGIDKINFSIDGASEDAYEAIRRGLSFKTTKDNIMRLINRKSMLNLNQPKISVVFVKQDSNKEEVDKFRSFWMNKTDSVVISSDDNRNNTVAFFKGNKKRYTPFPCRRLWGEITVMSSGKIPLCCVDFDGKIVVGDFNKQTLREVWNSEAYRRIRQLHFNFQADSISLCKACVHPHRMNLRSWW